MSLRRTLLAAVIALSGLASVSANRPPKVIPIVIDKAAFANAPDGIKVGDTIEWINKDVVSHTATARDKEWDIVVPSGRKVRFVLKKSGTVDYFCRYHPNMTGRIVIGSREK